MQTAPPIGAMVRVVRPDPDSGISCILASLDHAWRVAKIEPRSCGFGTSNITVTLDIPNGLLGSMKTAIVSTDEVELVEA